MNFSRLSTCLSVLSLAIVMKTSTAFATAFQHHSMTRRRINLRINNGSSQIPRNPHNLPYNPNVKSNDKQFSKLYMVPPSTVTSAVAAIIPSPSTTSTVLATLMSYLQMSHQNTFFVLSSVLALSSFGLILEKRTTIGKALSVRIFKKVRKFRGLLITH